MGTVIIHHNPACGTSRNTLGLIRNAGIEPRIIEYLRDPPSREELVRMIAAAGLTVREAVREKGTPFHDLGLGDPGLSDQQLLDAMLEHPILINRPFVVTELGTRLCRPSERVLEILPQPQQGRFCKEDGEVVIDAAGRRLDEPQWLLWARELQSIAQAGLTFNRDPYDRERYTMVNDLSRRILAAQTGEPMARISALYAGESGYLTPKIDVRAAVFDTDQRLLMVREASDHRRWTLPGGWADVNLSPAENTLKEVREESGYEARIVKLAAAWDRARQGHPPSAWSCLKMFFICELAGGAPRSSHETLEVAWFARDGIPADLSLGRVLPQQIRRMYEHLDQPSLPVDFD